MEYLDGNYFYPALSQIDVDNIVQPKPFVVQIHNNEAYFTKTHMLTSGDSIVRLIVETYDNNKLIGKHSNLLIIKPSEGKIYRFDPLDDWDDIPMYDIFPGYDILVEDYHPQSRNNDGFWCNAYVIERASAYIQDRQPNDIDGEGYAQVVMALVKPLPGDPDVEFGPGRRGARRTGRRTARRVSRRY